MKRRAGHRTPRPSFVWADPNDHRRNVEARINGLLGTKPSSRVLDAGCGADRSIAVPQGSRVTGIDLLESQVSRNPLLDEVIVGDIQTFDFGQQRFDLIICWEVLEHLPDAGRALRNLAGTLAIDGLLLLAVPNLWSCKGMVTKFTSHRLHVLIYRHLLGAAWAGGERGPFPTFLQRTMGPGALLHFARESGLAVEYLGSHEASAQQDLRRRLGLVGWKRRAAGRALAVLTHGRLRLRETELVMLLRKLPSAP